MNISKSKTSSNTHENIKKAFWNLYKTGGINKVSVTKICAHTGYNRSTFYAHFKDVYEVLNEIEKNILSPQEFHEIIINNLINGLNSYSIINMIVDIFDKNCEYLPVLLGPYGDPEFRHVLLNSFFPVINAYINYPEKESTHLKYILEYQNAAIISTISLWYENGKDIPQNEFIEILINLTSNGVKHELTKYSDL